MWQWSWEIEGNRKRNMEMGKGSGGNGKEQATRQPGMETRDKGTKELGDKRQCEMRDKIEKA